MKTSVLLVICMASSCFAGPWYDVVVRNHIDKTYRQDESGYYHVGLGDPVNVEIITGDNIGNLFDNAVLRVEGGSMINYDAYAGGNWSVGGDIIYEQDGEDFTLTLSGARGTDYGIGPGEKLFEFTFSADLINYLYVDAISGIWGTSSLVAEPWLGIGTADSVLPFAKFVHSCGDDDDDHEVPDPASVALVALGGLLLRRRK